MKHYVLGGRRAVSSPECHLDDVCEDCEVKKHRSGRSAHQERRGLAGRRGLVGRRGLGESRARPRCCTPASAQARREMTSSALWSPQSQKRPALRHVCCPLISWPPCQGTRNSQRGAALLRHCHFQSIVVLLKFRIVSSYRSNYHKPFSLTRKCILHKLDSKYRLGSS